MSRKDGPGLAATRNPGDFDILYAIKDTPSGDEWKCPCCGGRLPFQSRNNGKQHHSNAEQVLE